MKHVFRARINSLVFSIRLFSFWHRICFRFITEINWWSSLSSRRTASTDFRDSTVLSVHHSWQVLLPRSSVCIEIVKMSLRVGQHYCVQRRTSHLSSSLLLQQCPMCFVRLTWIVCEMGGSWLNSCCFVEYCFQDFWKQFAPSLYSSHLDFSPSALFKSWWCSHTLVLTWLQLDRNSRFILSERSDFQMIINLSIVVHAFPVRMLTSLSVDEILLLRYMNWSTNLRGFSWLHA